MRHAIANARGSLPALVTVVLLLATGLAHDVQAQSGAADATTPFDDQLHAGMLELRRLERMNDRAGAIRVGEQLLREYPDHPRVEEALLHLYRLERRDQQLIALLARRVERNAGSPEILREARELGTYLLAHKRHSEALAMMQRVIAANPLDETRYRMAAVLLRSHRHLDLAIEIYRQGRRATGREILFAAELAQLEEARGNYSAAIGEYLLLVMDPDRRPRARRKIIRLLERADDPAEVLRRVDDLRRKHPRSAAVQDIAATAYLQSGRLEDAYDAARAADRYADDQGEHLLEFGRLALQTAEGQAVDLERARLGVRVLERLPKAHPKSNLIPESARLLAEGLVAVARQVEDEPTRTELLESAVESLDTTVGEPRFVALQSDALALKAMILFEDLERPEAALATFERLVEHQRVQNESDHMVRVQMGLCLAALDRFDEARSVLEEVADSGSEPPPELQMQPQPNPRRPHRKKQVTPETVGRSRARYHLAELDLVEGKFDQAIDGFAALAEEAPEDRLANDCLDLALLLNEASLDPTPDARARFSSYRGSLLRRNPQAARAELEKLVAEHSESTLHPIALFELASTFDAEGKFDLALQQYDKLVELHAEHRLAARALEAIGDVHLDKLGQPEEAIASYERVLLDYPDDLFLDDVRKKLLTARRALKEEDDATP
ncbi:MAG: tetratricopeptide repeat protein [Candidatus Latescibacterota bacterium]|nr:MAG: tetratricopeptide repeat protein [Candidatus Latescibacterota bacterium]